jgi:hypothetical protein
LTYTVSYRRALGNYSTNLGAAYAGKVNIHWYDSNGTSAFVGALSPGEQRTYSGVVVARAASDNTSDNWAEVTITTGVSATATPTRTPTATPTNTSTTTATPTATPVNAPPTSSTATPSVPVTATPKVPSLFSIVGRLLGHFTASAKYTIVVKPTGTAPKMRLTARNGRFTASLSPGSYRLTLKDARGRTLGSKTLVVDSVERVNWRVS